MPCDPAGRGESGERNDPESASFAGAAKNPGPERGEAVLPDGQAGPRARNGGGSAVPSQGFGNRADRARDENVICNVPQAAETR